ncbi:DNA cytosine methyltransferase [Marinobacter sp. DS40M6]|uniref:DNA cytosine methyltransferase n=1 Tax=Marinobacter sp. DS40M6 TaxID=1597776 RepID=UPI00235825EB|nr:DNA cytosine methyltransferase [Marinobacter sp. DS40M6]MDC8457846.1 DNA cytosine methyltransferase [Marinobacter sp. DS40M6]
MVAYYNEIDPYAAEWLRNLILMGEIAPGIVDERSIEDVSPDDLREFTQCHFFAGIGVWSLSLRRAGWSDDRPIWTGSCPCQPFSSSGRRTGFADERHLWPHWYWLIDECRPSAIVGEQVASKDAGPWIDLVQADLEALDYAFGCVPFPSAGVGAPHIRDRAYWLAHSSSTGLEKRVGNGRVQREKMVTRQGQTAIGSGDFIRVGNTAGQGPFPLTQSGVHRGEESTGARDVEPERSGASINPGPTNGFWASSDWLFCRDGKWRPVEPGTFPLAHGAPARVGRLRAYGNAINAEAATVFIESVMDTFELNYN